VITGIVLHAKSNACKHVPVITSSVFQSCLNPNRHAQLNRVLGTLFSSYFAYGRIAYASTTFLSHLLNRVPGPLFSKTHFFVDIRRIFGTSTK
jgi:hypothetical protein